jgi:hypothetical protein
MPTSHNPALRQTIVRLLAQQVRTGAQTLPEAAVRVYGKMAQQLTPLIGDAGVEALAARSLYLAQREFPCLAEILNPEQSHEPFAQLGPCLARQEPRVAIDAAAALLATFTELLKTLVGEGLTTRMVGVVWSSGSPDEARRELAEYDRESSD